MIDMESMVDLKKYYRHRRKIGFKKLPRGVISWILKNSDTLDLKK